MPLVKGTSNKRLPYLLRSEVNKLKAKAKSQRKSWESYKPTARNLLKQSFPQVSDNALNRYL